jgi:altronate hydrolase
LCASVVRASALAASPSLKLSTNTALWINEEDDIDVNCGEVIDGSTSSTDRTADVRFVSDADRRCKTVCDCFGE